MCKNVKTVSEYLQESKSFFDTSFSEREKRQMMKQVLQHVLACETHDLISRSNKELTVHQQDVVGKMVSRINNGEPFQYILGKTFFYEQEFICDSRALIPRPETEELVHSCVQLLKKNESINKVLDIGTGTGCIAISLKNAVPTAEVSAIDISIESLALAKENARFLSTKVKFAQHDILKGPLNASYDLIISNPPYIPNHESNLMEDNVLKYEPSVALFVHSSDPILFYKRIADAGISMLKKSGYLAFEIHENWASEVEKYLNLKGYINIEIKKDLQGKDRMIFAQL